MMKNSVTVRVRTALVCTLGLMASCVSWAVPAIDTTSTWNGSTKVEGVGVSLVSTMGQTITLTQTSEIGSFSFRLGRCQLGPYVFGGDGTRPTTNLTVRGYIYAWDGTKPSGAPLYSSADVVFPAPDAYGSTFLPVTFTPPSGQTLDPGNYVLFITTAGLRTGQQDLNCAMGAGNNLYTNGKLVYKNTANNTNWTTTSAWDEAGDAAFTFGVLQAAPSQAAASIPTLSEWAMIFLASLMGLFGYTRLRNRRA